MAYSSKYSKSVYVFYMEVDFYISVIATTDGRTIKNEDPDQPDIMLNLGTILTFATHPSPMGFPNDPEIIFDNDHSKTLPYA